MADKNKKDKIDFPNMRLVKFYIQTQTSLANSICKACYK